MAASDARGRVAWRARAVRAARLLFLCAGMAVCSFYLNLHHAGAAAAWSVLRAAASFAVRQYIGVVANAIVIVLFALFLRDDEAFSFSAAAFFARWWPSEFDGDAQDWCLPSLPPGPPLMLMLPPPPPPPATEAAAEEEVFEDKKVVHVTTVRAQPPRRSKSEKAGGGKARRSKKAALELRRAESENGRQLQPAEPEVPPVELRMVMDGEDEAAFQRRFDAYILKMQTQFQSEESAAAAKAAAAGKGGPVAAGVVVAVK
ncbi:unnamed protein product [Urochloa decumbens]|uniref:Uncharacterized protein n=1 Tax=Urochloa decumbens TaxID=240449 RepID=A0ABC9AAY9_9POAL